MTRLQRALARLVSDLRDLGSEWALIGGLAVSARAEPRATRDVDVAMAVDGDQDAEQVVAMLTARGYLVETVLEHKAVGRMATVRLMAPGKGLKGVLIDLFFASSGVEPEIVENADLVEIWPGMSVPLATTGHLVALKVLSSRPKDLEDITFLLANASPEDLESARKMLAMITERGYHRDKNLLAILNGILSQPSSEHFLERKPLD